MVRSVRRLLDPRGGAAQTCHVSPARDTVRGHGRLGSIPSRGARSKLPGSRPLRSRIGCARPYRGFETCVGNRSGFADRLRVMSSLKFSFGVLGDSLEAVPPIGEEQTESEQLAGLSLVFHELVAEVLSEDGDDGDRFVRAIYFTRACLDLIVLLTRSGPDGETGIGGAPRVRRGDGGQAALVAAVEETIAHDEEFAALSAELGTAPRRYVAHVSRTLTLVIRTLLPRLGMSNDDQDPRGDVADDEDLLGLPAACGMLMSVAALTMCHAARLTPRTA